jgi:hypothetical protein
MLLGGTKGFLFQICEIGGLASMHAQESQFLFYFGWNLWSSQNGNDP